MLKAKIIQKMKLKVIRKELLLKVKFSEIYRLRIRIKLMM
jgi:hypothetical protein